VKGVRKEEELDMEGEEEGPIVVEDEVEVTVVGEIHTAAEAAEEEEEAMTGEGLDTIATATATETIETVDQYRSRKDRKSTSQLTQWDAEETE